MATRGKNPRPDKAQIEAARRRMCGSGLKSLLDLLADPVTAREAADLSCERIAQAAEAIVSAVALYSCSWDDQIEVAPAKKVRSQLIGLAKAMELLADKMRALGPDAWFFANQSAAQYGDVPNWQQLHLQLTMLASHLKSAKQSPGHKLDLETRVLLLSAIGAWIELKGCLPRHVESPQNYERQLLPQLRQLVDVATNEGERSEALTVDKFLEAVEAIHVGAPFTNPRRSRRRRVADGQ